jgi:hypothetical protein
MVEGFTQQTKDNCIPKGQLCQEFDAILSSEHYKADLKNFLPQGVHPSVHCLAPAYYYVFGINGEKFLCDFHYHLEFKSMMGTISWPRINEYFAHVYSNAEAILDTFLDPPDSPKPTANCWCGKMALVFVEDPNIAGLCNFHYRKMFYRWLNNDMLLHPKGRKSVNDYRKLFISSIEEDYSLENLKTV